MAKTIMKQKVKVAPERRGMKSIWNISDWEATSVPAQTIMVLGVSVPPGGVVSVPEERLKNAHKTLKDRDAGLLFIGDAPPAEYLSSKKKPVRAKVPRGTTRSHGKEVVPTSEEIALAVVPLPEDAPAAEVVDPPEPVDFEAD